MTLKKGIEQVENQAIEYEDFLLGDSGQSTTNKNTDFNNITSLLFQHQMIVSHRISLYLHLWWNE